jgi:hypothetical protein
MTAQDRLAEIEAAWEQGTPMPPDANTFLIAEVKRLRSDRRAGAESFDRLEAQCETMEAVVEQTKLAALSWRLINWSALATLIGKDPDSTAQRVRSVGATLASVDEALAALDGEGK